MENKKCICGGSIIFIAHVASPGYGKFYECEQCHEPYWSGRGDSLIACKDMEPEDNIMDESWVI